MKHCLQYQFPQIRWLSILRTIFIFNGKINSIPIKEKDKLDIINNLSEEQLSLFENMNSHFDKNLKNQTLYEIDILPIYNPINSNEMFMILN